MDLGISFDPGTGTLVWACRGRTYFIRGWPAIRESWFEPDGADVAWRPSLRIPPGDLAASIERLQTPVTNRRQFLFDFMHSPEDRRSRRDAIAWLRWCQLIPTVVRDIVTSFQSDRWELLAFLAACGAPAVDLAKSNPALAFALAKRAREISPGLGAKPDPAGLPAARELLAPGRKQREILGRLGFPATDAARRLMAKVPAGVVSGAFLERLRQAMSDPEAARILARLPSVNAGALAIAADPALRERVDLAFLSEVCRSPMEARRWATARLLRRTFDLARRFLPGTEADRAPRTVADLQEMSRGLEEVESQYGAGLETVAFPRPPVMGTDTIVPITTAVELIHEGWIQHHCAAGYVRRVAIDEDAYFYKVLAPERCTLMLAWSRHDWAVREIRTACNGNVSHETMEAVKDWMVRMTGLPREWTISSGMRGQALIDAMGARRRWARERLAAARAVRAGAAEDQEDEYIEF